MTDKKRKKWKGKTPRERLGKRQCRKENGSVIFSKRTGKPCGGTPIPGRDQCYTHGGSTPRGFALPQTKTGKYSKDLPTRLAARRTESMKDRDLMNPRRDAALNQARLDDMFEALGSGSTRAHLKTIKELSDIVQLVVDDNNDPDKLKSTLEDLRTAICESSKDEAILKEMDPLTDQRMRILEVHRKREADQEGAMGPEQSMLLVAFFVSTVNLRIAELKQSLPKCYHKHVKKVMKNISDDIRRSDIIGPG